MSTKAGFYNFRCSGPEEAEAIAREVREREEQDGREDHRLDRRKFHEAFTKFRHETAWNEAQDPLTSFKAGYLAGIEEERDRQFTAAREAAEKRRAAIRRSGI